MNGLKCALRIDTQTTSSLEALNKIRLFDKQKCVVFKGRVCVQPKLSFFTSLTPSIRNALNIPCGMCANKTSDTIASTLIKNTLYSLKKLSPTAGHGLKICPFGICPTSFCIKKNFNRGSKKRKYYYEKHRV